MKRLIITFVGLIFCNAFGQVQNLTPSSTNSQALKADRFIGFDTYENQYFIKDNNFFKQNKNKSWQYKNIALSKINQVDLQNPLQLVLFYKDFNTVVVLDSQLNETSKINFSETAPDLSPQTVSLASQNSLWVFDLNSQKLGLFDILKNKFHSITVPFKESIVAYQSDYNYFYWIDSKQNCYVSTTFGTISFLGKVPEFDQMQLVTSKSILLKKDSIFTLYYLEKETSQNISINEKTFKNFYYKDQILSIFTSEGITNYKITIP